MNHLETLLSWLTLGFCGSSVRALCFAPECPESFLFLSYSTATTVSTIGVWLVYKFFGFRSLAAYYSCLDFDPTECGNTRSRNRRIMPVQVYRLCRGIWGLVCNY